MMRILRQLQTVTPTVQLVKGQRGPFLRIQRWKCSGGLAEIVSKPQLWIARFRLVMAEDTLTGTSRTRVLLAPDFGILGHAVDRDRNGTLFLSVTSQTLDDNMVEALLTHKKVFLEFCFPEEQDMFHRWEEPLFLEVE